MLRHTLVDFVVCIRVASFWFVISRLEEILGRMALAGVGFSRVVVWMEGCVLGRSGESRGVDLDGAGWIQMERGWIVV